MSILDGSYWENLEKEREKYRESLLDRIPQDKLNNKMPCNSCSISDICNYAFNIKCSHYNEDLFEIEIRCKRYISK